MHDVAIVFGTRPEAIKFAPIISALRRDPRFNPVVISTGQHREMLDSALEVFGITPDIDLSVMTREQTLTRITSKSLSGLDQHVDTTSLEAILVHGDTAATLAGALFGFHNEIPVIHVEAGLRSGELFSPFPEEGNRRLVGQIASLHLAPTSNNSANLIQEQVKPDNIVITGNTVIDALRWACEQSTDYGAPELAGLDSDGRRIVLASAHRRESRAHLPAIADALARISEEPDVHVIVPLHRNPAVREAILPHVAEKSNITVIDPLPYANFCRLMQRSDIILSDSSGAEEEGPSLGKPTLVLREVSERPEAITAGTAKLVHRSTERIVDQTLELLRSESEYRRMATAANPYGDGRATERTIGALAHFFAEGPPVLPFVPGWDSEQLDREFEALMKPAPAS